MKHLTTYIALDAHKNFHKVAMIRPGCDEIEEWTVANTVKDLRRMLARIQKSAQGPVEICYEAGVCGFALQRRLTGDGVTCRVIAPSLVPVKPGERIKTDRRDAHKLLHLFCSGLLTEVHAPDELAESVRDLVRAREAAQADLLRGRHRLQKFLVRRAMVYRDGRNWTQKYHRWLRSLRFDEKLDRFVFEHYLATVSHQLQVVEELTAAVAEMAEQSPYAEPVGWLRCFRGIDTLAAMTLVSELYGFERFSSPRRLMGYVGVTPSEHSSGEKEHKGGITKAGNGRVRRILTEIAWHQIRPLVVSKNLRRRREGQPAWVIALADRAMRRLYRRYWRLAGNGKPPAKAIIAVARELTGFVWATLYLKDQSVLTARQLRHRPQRQRRYQETPEATKCRTVREPARRGEPVGPQGRVDLGELVGPSV